MSTDGKEIGPFRTCREVGWKVLEVRWSMEHYLPWGQADKLEKLKKSRKSFLIRIKARCVCGQGRIPSPTAETPPEIHGAFLTKGK